MATASNAMFFLVSTVFQLYIWIILLRLMLQAVRADFYNPISQLVWQLTQPLLRPVQRLLPKWGRVDTAAAVLLVLVTLVYVYAIAWITQPILWPLDPLVAGYHTLLKIIVMTLYLYTFTLVIQAILSWVGPGVNNPAGSILWSVNEPLLRPVRRVIPPMSGLDLSPLVVILLLQFVNLLVPLHGIYR